MTPGIWAIEESLWTGGRAAYLGAIHERAVFTFAPPTGILQGTGFVDDLPEEGAWRSVEMEDRVESAPTDDLRLIAYRAKGERMDGTGSRAMCSSAYLREAGDWLLVHHQQTPIAD